jgi:MFS family permease
MSLKSPQLKLLHYFGLEAIGSISVTLFCYCAFFWTKAKFGYTDTENLLLATTHGLTYIFASKYGGKISDRLGYDRMILICAVGCALTLSFGWIPKWHGTPFVVMILYTLFIGPSWPALEAAIMHGNGTTSMPDRLSFYNITWGIGDAIGFYLSGWLFIWNPDSILWAAALFHGFQAFWVLITPKNLSTAGETAMNISHSGDGIKPLVKRRFMHTAWLGNGLAFLMLAGFSALTPQMGERLGLSPASAIWLATTLLLSRGIAFVIFWKWNSWHYHKGWSQWALYLAPISLGFVFFAPSIWVVFGSLAIFGVTIALSYAGSLYYSMDYGENKGEHAGLHESIIGMGVFVGPLIASLVSMRAGSVGAQWSIISLAICLSLVGMALIHFYNRPKG